AGYRAQWRGGLARLGIGAIESPGKDVSRTRSAVDSIEPVSAPRRHRSRPLRIRPDEPRSRPQRLQWAFPSMFRSPIHVSHAEVTSSARRASWRDYYELGKPRVVMLIMVTAVVGMFLATPDLPPPNALILGTLGIALAASSAAA